MWYKQAQENTDPLRVYHGTSKEYEGVPAVPKRGQFGPFVFVSEHPETADNFARGDNRRVLTMDANVRNPFDPKDVLQHPAILKYMASWANGAGYQGRRDWTPDLNNPGFRHLAESVANNSGDDAWLLESSTVKRYLKSRGYDAIKLWENGRPTYAIFDSAQLSMV